MADGALLLFLPDDATLERGFFWGFQNFVHKFPIFVMDFDFILPGYYLACTERPVFEMA